jgi:hypothetical protein
MRLDYALGSIIGFILCIAFSFAFIPYLNTTGLPLSITIWAWFAPVAMAVASVVLLIKGIRD